MDGVFCLGIEDESGSKSKPTSRASTPTPPKDRSAARKVVSPSLQQTTDTSRPASREEAVESVDDFDKTLQDDLPLSARDVEPVESFVNGTILTPRLQRSASDMPAETSQPPLTARSSRSSTSLYEDDSVEQGIALRAGYAFMKPAGRSRSVFDTKGRSMESQRQKAKSNVPITAAFTSNGEDKTPRDAWGPSQPAAKSGTLPSTNSTTASLLTDETVAAVVLRPLKQPLSTIQLTTTTNKSSPRPNIPLALNGISSLTAPTGTHNSSLQSPEPSKASNTEKADGDGKSSITSQPRVRQGQMSKADPLARKKTFYMVDTSYSHKNLKGALQPAALRGAPPPRRRKSLNDMSAASNGSSGAAAVGVIVVASPRLSVSSRVGAGARKQQTNANIHLEGRWTSAGPNKRYVGFYSLPADKPYDPGWRCQDAILVQAPFAGQRDQALFAVFDGHGINGRRVSSECMDRLPRHIASAGGTVSTTSNGVVTGSGIGRALKRACGWLHRDICGGTIAGDCSHSGTTLCAAILHGRRLTLANLGDSRAALVRRKKGAGPTSAYECVALTRDHKPHRPDEMERIIQAGGEVYPIPETQSRPSSGSGTVVNGDANGVDAFSGREAQRFGPPSRVWMQTGEGPGLAMSRSIGDKIAHTCGVSCDPEISEISLDPSTDILLLLATDGCWDALSVDDIASIVTPLLREDTWSPTALCEAICNRARAIWEAEGGGSSDDTTALIVKLSDILKEETNTPAANTIRSDSWGQISTRARRSTTTMGAKSSTSKGSGPTYLKTSSSADLTAIIRASKP